ncbi:hypothetical protein FPSE_04667 [Fusarium pseudograminearum CS3096]
MPTIQSQNLDRLLIQHLESERERERMLLYNSLTRLGPISAPFHRGTDHYCIFDNPSHMKAVGKSARVRSPTLSLERDLSEWGLQVEYICSLSWWYTGNHYRYQMLRRSERKDCNGPFDVNWGRVCSPLDLSLIQEYKMAGRYTLSSGILAVYKK